jgi:hypothetical protein
MIPHAYRWTHPGTDELRISVAPSKRPSLESVAFSGKYENPELLALEII